MLTISAIVADAETWCRGRWWGPRAALLVLLAWTAAKVAPGGQLVGTWFSGIDLGIHEGGHLLFRFFPELLYVAGGTLAQLAAPVAAAAMLARQGDRFGIVFCCAWLGINFTEVAVYMADARAMQLPLVTIGGGEAGHDWNYLLDRFGLLDWDHVLAGFTHVLGMALLAAALGAGAWLVWRMFFAWGPDSRSSPQERASGAAPKKPLL